MGVGKCEMRGGDSAVVWVWGSGEGVRRGCWEVGYVLG
jgi:hypothetical protein